MDQKEKAQFREELKERRRSQTIKSAIWARNFSNEELLKQGLELIEFAIKGFDKEDER